ncbi:MAG: ATPase [Kosakonia cowanii]|nr:ATPase [Kosakonia cowanii]
MKRFASGLIVGKFAPLHCGHERLINTALAQCERLWLISYSVPELPGCEPEKRETARLRAGEARALAAGAVSAV